MSAERIIVQTSPHWKVLVPSAISLVLSGATSLAVLPAAVFVYEIPLVLWAVASACVLAARAAYMTTTRWVVTTEHLWRHEGALWPTDLNHPLSQIRSVDLNAGILDQQWHTGDLTITMSAGNSVVLHAVRNAPEFRRELLRVIDAERSQR